VNKKILAVFILFLIMVSAQAKAEQQISFIWDTGVGGTETLQGVDDDTTGWSNNDSMVKLGASNWSLLGATAEVLARDGGKKGKLTHRGTRGLGIWGGENDEIDSYNDVEKLSIQFGQPTLMKAFEVRSLYYEDDLLKRDHKERGIANFWLGNSLVFTQQLVGVENIETPGTKGIVDYSYDDPFLFDRVVFNVPKCQWYTYQSEFAVAKLTTVPEPMSTVLFITGGTILVVRRLRRKK